MSEPADYASEFPVDGDPVLDRLLDAAVAVRAQAYAPYSRFAVGAALLTKNGRIHVGANVENASYPVGQCAEASAIGAMIAAGDRRILAVAVSGAPLDADPAALPPICTPCGACRQRLNEFSDPLVPLVIGDAGGVRLATTLGVLLPHAFGPDHLDGS